MFSTPLFSSLYLLILTQKLRKFGFLQDIFFSFIQPCLPGKAIWPITKKHITSNQIQISVRALWFTENKEVENNFSDHYTYYHRATL